jgi:hypothetical protein
LSEPLRDPLEPEREPEPLEPEREREPLEPEREPEPDLELAPRELDPADPELLVRDREPAPELLLRAPELLLRELPPDFEPELSCLLSLSSVKIELLGLVCRGPGLALRQALHQPLLLPLALLGREPAVLGVQLELEQIPLDERRVVQLAVRLVGHLLDHPRHPPDGGEREQEKLLEQPHLHRPRQFNE